MKLSIVIIVLLKYVFSRDKFTINFIKSYIENEGKPTTVIYSGLCWGRHQEVNMMKELSKFGVRMSSSMAERSPHQDQHLLFLIDLECPRAENVINDAKSKNLFQFPFRWLVLSNTGIDVSKSSLWTCPVLTGSDLVLAVRDGDRIIMDELHKPSLDYPMLSAPRGFYNGSFFDTRPHRELYRRRKDLMGVPVTMANVIQDSNTTKNHILKEENRIDLDNDAVPKGCWVAAKYSFEMLNATRRSIFSYRWGYKVNGEWSGMIADLEADKATLATNCIMFKNRLEVVTFTDMVVPVRFRFIFRQPSLTYTSNIFSLPFATSVWVAIVVCSAAATLTLFLTSMWEVQMERNPTQLDGGISDALLITLSAVAQQGCFIEPRRAPGRITEWFLFCALMALYAAYSANIVVLLQAPSNSIKNLAHLSTSKIQLGAVDLDYSRFVLSSFNDSTHVGIYRRVIPENGPPNLYSIDDGVEKIRQGLFAFHCISEPVYRRVAKTFLETEKCDINQVDFVNGFDGYTPVKKDSPYLEVIRVTYKQLRESGILKSLVQRYSLDQPHCVTRVASFSSVGLLDMRPVLIFMLYGVAFSIFIFVGEVTAHKLANKLRKHLKKIKEENNKRKTVFLRRSLQF